MKFYCVHCDLLVAEIKEGSQIRKGTKMVCGVCSTNEKPSKPTMETPKFLGPIKSLFGKRF